MNRLAKRDLARGSIIIVIATMLFIFVPDNFFIAAWFCIVIIAVGIGLFFVAILRRNYSEHDYEYGKQ